MSAAINEVLTFLEHLKQQAAEAGTLRHGNVPVDMEHLEAALTAAKSIADAPPAPAPVVQEKQEDRAHLVQEYTSEVKPQARWFGKKK